LLSRDMAEKPESQVGLSVLSFPELDWILDVVLEAVVEKLKADVASVMLLDERTNELVIRKARGLADEIVQKVRMRLDDTISGLAMQRRETLVLNNGGTDENIRPLLTRPDVKASLVAPICTQRKVFGTLNVASRKSGRTFTAKGRDIISQIASQTGELIQRFHDSEQQRYISQGMNIILTVSQALDQAETLETVADNALEGIRALYGDVKCAATLLDARKPESNVVSARGLQENDWPIALCLALNGLSQDAMTGEDDGAHKPAQLGLSSEFTVLRTEGETNVTGEARVLHIEHSTLGRVTFAPLRVGDIIGGLVVLEPVDCYMTPVMMKLLAELARETSLAADRIRKTDRLLEMAFTDELTGARNLRYFRERIQEEAHRARRRNTTFGVLMVDVDLFKEYNDRYGHLAGDRALVKIANGLRSSCRDMDVVARYGGDEFIILLPEVDRAAAGAVSKRIQDAVNNRRELLAEGEQMPTISGGLAMWPEDGETPDDVVRAADRVLYESKHRGRGRISTSRPANDKGDASLQQE